MNDYMKEEVRKLALWIHSLSQLYPIRYCVLPIVFEDGMCFFVNVSDGKNMISVIDCGFTIVEYYNEELYCWEHHVDISDPSRVVDVNDKGELRMPRALLDSDKCVYLEKN